VKPDELITQDTGVPEEINRKNAVDYVYKRCYVDKHGNTIDPRTLWDEYLKYYKSWNLLVGVGSGEGSAPLPVQAKTMIRREEAQKAKIARAQKLEAEYLEGRSSRRRREARKRVHKLESDYLASKKSILEAGKRNGVKPI
jgi:hypothetical protein